MKYLYIEVVIFSVVVVCAVLAFLLFGPLSISQKQNIPMITQQDKLQLNENKKIFDCSEPYPPVPPYMMPHPKMKF